MAQRLLIGDASVLPSIGPILKGPPPRHRGRGSRRSRRTIEEQHWWTDADVTVRCTTNPDPERISAALQAGDRDHVRSLHRKIMHHEPAAQSTLIPDEGVAVNLGVDHQACPTEKRAL